MYTVVLGWLAGLFAVMAATLALAAAVVGWPILLLAVPLAGVAYLFWYHASGRLTEQLRQQAREGRSGARRDRRQRRAAATGFGAQNDARWHATGQHWREERRRAQERTAERRRRGSTGFGPNGVGRRSAGPRGRYAGTPQQETGMSPDTARGVLDVRSDADADADADAVREAYREKVKETHPDRGGSTEAFKRVNEAYETLGGTA